LVLGICQSTNWLKKSSIIESVASPNTNFGLDEVVQRAVVGSSKIFQIWFVLFVFADLKYPKLEGLYELG